MHLPGVIGDTAHALAAQAAAFEALLLCASALHKAVKWGHLRGVMRQFAGIPAPLAPFALAGVAVLEVGAGFLLFLPALHTIGAVLAAVVWMTYLMLIVRAIAQGRRDADCGCSFGGAHRSLGTYQVTRNGVLSGLAVLVALDFDLGGGGVQTSQLLPACALLALYGALDQVMALQPLRGGEVL